MVLLLFFIPFFSYAGPKTDTVYLYNGDRITGEIKRFEYGILVLKTDGLGTLKIEFDRIKTFYSKDQFTVQLSNGLRFFGSIDTSGTPGYVNLKVESFSIPEPISAIVEIFPVKRVFWKRLDGAIDLGYSYTKASTVSQLNFSTNVDYRVKKSFTQLSGDLIFTDQQDRDRIRKQDYGFVFNRFFRKTVFASAFIGGQQNTELGTELRLYGGLGIGNDFVHNNLHVLNGALGALVSTEISQDDSTINSVEGVMHWNYKIFRFNNPEIDVTSFFNVYPSLTSLGRVRLEFQVKAMIEIFNDFFFGLTFWDNYDSEPLDPTATKNDWGVNTSIGYSW
jgi:hypothetical protein